MAGGRIAGGGATVLAVGRATGRVIVGGRARAIDGLACRRNVAGGETGRLGVIVLGGRGCPPKTAVL
tara:strand:+ start:922 stop:1122 length:201 start_codon:yes stop_codon:yes gene_type:complete